MNVNLYCANAENCSYTIKANTIDAETFDQIICPNCGSSMQLQDSIEVEINYAESYTPYYS